jgi:hypothetical protein
MSRALRLTVVAATLVWIASASPAMAAQPYLDQFQISQVGPDGDASRSAVNPGAAFDPSTGEALVVWFADSDQDEKFEIWGRFVNSDGQLQGGQFRIATAGAPGDAGRDCLSPRVAYNSVRNEFLVVWGSDSEAVDDDFEIRGQRVGAAGQLIGGEHRLSDMGPGNATYNASEPQVAYNPVRDEYVVVYHGVDDALPGRTEVYGRRVSGDGLAQGSDVHISALRNSATWPTIAYNSQANEYLVAFIGDDSPTNPTSQRTFVQRLTADAAPVGPNRQVFQSGEVHKPAVVYNPTVNQYLVATPGIVNGDVEAYVQRLDGNGVEIGVDDERISHMGPDGAPDYGLGVDVAVGYSPARAQYLVTWHGDTTSFGLVKDENEVFGQGLDVNGSEIGVDDQPFSSMGPDGTPQYGVDNFQFDGPLAYAPDRDRWFVVWTGDNGPPSADNETEVFGHMIGTSPPPPAPPPVMAPAPPPPPPPVPPIVSPHPAMPNFTVQFSTSRARGRRGVHGLLYSVAGFDRLPNSTIVTVRCDKGCTMKTASFTVRTKASKGKKKKTSMTLSKPVHLGAKSRIRVTARHSGYRSRYIRYKFVVRRGFGLDPRRVGSGCQTPTKPVRNTSCAK